MASSLTKNDLIEKDGTLYRILAIREESVLIDHSQYQNGSRELYVLLRVPLLREFLIR